MRALGEPAQAELVLGDFKTAPGEHGAHDRFLGIRATVIHAEDLIHKAAGWMLDHAVEHLPPTVRTRYVAVRGAARRGVAS